jgi:hypothetical protein
MRLPCLRGSDPMLDEIREVFGANPIRIPDSRVTPGVVLMAVDNGPLRYRGKLEPLIDGDPPFKLPSKLFKESQIAHLSGKRTSCMDLNLGFELLDGWAAGLGLGGAIPSVKTQYAAAREVWFAFVDVKRKHLDLGELAGVLGKRKLVRNAATQPFLDVNKPARMLLVTSVLMSHSFSFGGTSTGNSSLNMDFRVIEQALGNVSVGSKIEQASADTIAFAGPQPLTFAFTVIELQVKLDGRIESYNESRKGEFMSAGNSPLPEGNFVAKFSPERVIAPDLVAEIEFGGE